MPAQHPSIPFSVIRNLLTALFFCSTSHDDTLSYPLLSSIVIIQNGTPAVFPTLRGASRSQQFLSGEALCVATTLYLFLAMA